MTNNEGTINEKKLNTEQLEEVAGGISGTFCPKCGSSKLRIGGSVCACNDCSASWMRVGIGSGYSYHNSGNVRCPSCGSKSLEFLLRSTSTVKYSCKNCHHPFALHDGHYC